MSLHDTGPIIELVHLSKSVPTPKGQKTILRDIELCVRAQDMVALVGPSGSGKSTLLSIVSAMDQDFGGEVRVLGRTLKAMTEVERAALRNKDIGVVFQAFHLLSHLSVRENVELPLWLRRDHPTKKETESLAEEALDFVGLKDRIHEPIHHLSGGEQQRIGIARAVVARPKLLVADEPTGNLDPKTSAQIYELFTRLRNELNTTLVVATHDEQLMNCATSTLTLKRPDDQEEPSS